MSDANSAWRSLVMRTTFTGNGMVRLFSSLSLFAVLVALTGFIFTQPLIAAPITTPANFSATLHDPHRIDLSWTSVAGVDGYHIEESTHSDFNPSILITVSGAASVTYQDVIVYPGATFYYRITAFIAAADSAVSPTQTITIPLSALAIPGGPTNLTGGFASANQINLTWTDNSANEVGYLLLRATSSDFASGLVSYDLPINTTTFSDTSVNVNNTYYYKISAFNALGVSTYSNIPLVSTIPVINLGSAPTLNPGDTLNRATCSFIDNDNPGTWSATVNYGDGSGASVLSLNVDKTFTLNHRYLSLGTFTITVSVTDSYNKTGTGTLQVLVAAPYVPPPPPPAPVNTSGFSPGSNQLQVDYTGTAQQTVTITSQDQGAKILVPQGSHLLTSGGAALTNLTCNALEASALPQAPANNVVASAYEFGPNGATFDPPITITLKFNPVDYSGVDLSTLKIGFWDGTTWSIYVASMVNLTTNEITVPVSHFTKFAVIGRKNISTPAATPVVTSTPSATPLVTPVVTATPTPTAAPTTVPATPPATTVPASITLPVITTNLPPTPSKTEEVTPAPTTTQTTSRGASYGWVWILAIGILLVVIILIMIIRSRTNTKSKK
jgi:hypothetical protein